MDAVALSNVTKLFHYNALQSITDEDNSGVFSFSMKDIGSTKPIGDIPTSITGSEEEKLDSTVDSWTKLSDRQEDLFRPSRAFSSTSWKLNSVMLNSILTFFVKCVR